MIAETSSLVRGPAGLPVRPPGCLPADMLAACCIACGGLVSEIGHIYFIDCFRTCSCLL